jgi:hypothetical protein
MPLPPEPDLELLHDRLYAVRAYRLSDTEFLLRGSVQDKKPAKVFIEGAQGSLDMHEMVVDLTIVMPQLEIIKAEVVFETHPDETCPGIAGAYQQLVGLSVARGFTHKLRELFGGPRGCQHVTALLQAMAPVAVQTLLGLMAPPVRGHEPKSQARPSEDNAHRDLGPEVVKQPAGVNRNTCHVWADDGPMADLMAQGIPVPVALPIARKLREEGIPLETWQRRFQ